MTSIKAWLPFQSRPARFSWVLANHYLDGRDSIGMYSDDEREPGLQPTIASISLKSDHTIPHRV